ncbi:uncharacterized protein LOC110934947 isoform X2 [Helianthus annuus]|nr:uncharacterized protein LOC110934944 isoform X2 [Helianthus annuus]XP_035844517.1 uncharacterized protein LOC110934947 isoform X2 [Helianthus annuus]
MMLLVDDDRSRLTGAEMKRRGGVVATTFFIDGLPWAAEPRRRWRWHCVPSTSLSMVDGVRTVTRIIALFVPLDFLNLYSCDISRKFSHATKVDY